MAGDEQPVADLELAVKQAGKSAAVIWKILLVAEQRFRWLNAPDRRYTFTVTVEGAPLELTDERIPNRNGIYRVAVARRGGAQITGQLRLGTQAAEQ